MATTFNENGIALTETQDGITMPIDCSFEKVNDWIHGPEVQYEELEALCLGMAAENDKLRQALTQQMQPPETAPKTGEPILAQIGTPHMVVAMWNAHESKWVVAAPHINMVDGKYTDPYFENEYVNEITGWMIIPSSASDDR